MFQKNLLFSACTHPKEWLPRGDTQSDNRGWLHPQAAQDPLWQEVQQECRGKETSSVGSARNPKLVGRLGVGHPRKGFG